MPALHDKYALHSSTVSRLTKQVADDALTYIEQRLSHADEQALTTPESVDQVVVMAVKFEQPSLSPSRTRQTRH